jgi:hypothetical protein
VLLEVDAGDRGAADVTGLPEPVVDAIDLRVGGAALAQREAAGELLVDRVRQALDLRRIEVGRQRVGRESRRVEDLVRPRAADAGQRPLVAQQRMQPPRVRREDLGEPVGAEPERLGA